MRRYFFGHEASTRQTLLELSRQCQGFINKPVDIRDQKALSRIFSLYQKDIKLIIHTAAQPSHDWAAREPLTDFSINAEGYTCSS